MALKALELLEAKRPEIEALCRKYGVTRLRLFGSATTDKWDPETSDFDFLAEFGPPPEGINLFDQLFGLIYRLEETMERRVDVVEWKAIQKPLFRESAEETALEWYAA